MGSTLAKETMEEECHVAEEFWEATTLTMKPTVTNANTSNAPESKLKIVDNRALRRSKRTIRSRTSSVELIYIDKN